MSVAAGLIIQSRQLKASQLQVMREMHLEVIKVSIDKPKLAASVYEAEFSAADAPKASYINLLFNYWQRCYSLKTMTREAVAVEAGICLSLNFLAIGGCRCVLLSKRSLQRRPIRNIMR
jgi:Family of unknown function (DUF6082)